jgi:hypothetical protein
MLGGVSVEHAPARDGVLRRIRTNDEMLVGQRDDRRLQSKLRHSLPARRYLARLFEHLHARQNLGRPDVQAHTLTRTQRSRRA